MCPKDALVSAEDRKIQVGMLATENAEGELQRPTAGDRPPSGVALHCGSGWEKRRWEWVEAAQQNALRDTYASLTPALSCRATRAGLGEVYDRRSPRRLQ